MKNHKTIPVKYQIFPILILIFWLIQFSATVAAPPSQGEDVAIITDPPSNAVVQGVVQIKGSADHPAFQFYKVEFAPEPVSDDQWQIIGDLRDVPVLNGVLETWDTTLYPDGSYTLRVRVVRQDGNYSEFFSQQVVISNAQPIPTDTPEVQETPLPTVTPTNLPPTPTIVIDQPVVDTPTPRPVETSPPLEDPDESQSFIPSISGFSLAPLRDTCLYGGAIMLGIFLLFGFLSALRIFIQGFVDRIQRRRK
ncbi:MAG: hypothetical protein JXM69_08580 [Anaerolineae bacterium]|nr:hypothetical protein [Anaerolineae bacterium]